MGLYDNMGADSVSNESKTHFRKVYKSNHLGQADIEEFTEAGTALNFTISHVKQEYGVSVAGRKGDHNIAYFTENIKPMVLNATNAKVVRGFAGSSFVEDWVNIPVSLYVDPSVRMKGDVVGGVRINNRQPPAQKPFIEQNSDAWKRAIASYNQNGNLNAVKKHMTVPPEAEALIIKEATGG